MTLYVSISLIAVLAFLLLFGSIHIKDGEFVSLKTKTGYKSGDTVSFMGNEAKILSAYLTLTKFKMSITYDILVNGSVYKQISETSLK